MKEALRFLLVLVPLLVSVERSECVRCFSFFDLTSGECDAEIGDVEDVDTCCQNPNYGYQAADGACQSCGPPAWSPWSSWSICNVVCGQGVRQKSRKCYGIGQSECENPKDNLQVEPCNGTCCNGQSWDSWLAWSPCSITCGGTGVRKRLRICSSHECQLACTGPSEETESCEAIDKCPVDGGWSSWSAWSQCSGSCVNDQGAVINTPSRVRERTCSSPAPSAYTVPPGRDCPGDVSQRQDCSELPNCAVDGNWGAWSAPGPCSVTCGVGLQLSSRNCDSPAPKYLGKPCEGPSTQSSVCQSPCPVHGFWSGWSNWGECSTSCIHQGRPSTRTRHRSCSNPAPSSNPRGNACQGDSSQTENCDRIPYCPVDGKWSSWSPYTSCPVTCGVGLQVSVRTCDSPAPKHGGRPCSGEERRTVLCSTQVHCPVHGVWSEWSKWGECRDAFRNKVINCNRVAGKQKRERRCLHRAHNGSICIGEKQLDNRVCYDVEKCYFKGTWESWGEWGFCQPSCGQRSRRRRDLICTPEYTDYRATFGRNNEEVTFFGKPRADCGNLPEGISNKYEFQDCHNVPACT